MRIRVAAAIGDDVPLFIQQEQAILVVPGPRKHDLYSGKCRDGSLIFFKEKGERIIRRLQNRDAEEIFTGDRKRIQSRFWNRDADAMLGELGTAGCLKRQQQARPRDPVIVGGKMFR